MKPDIHPIYIEDHSFQNLTPFLKDYNGYRILVLVDENTKEHCLPKLFPFIKDYNPEIIEISSGELHKNLQTCQFVWNRLLKIKASRNTLLINLGGGVISDLGGFIASVYKRGIPFIHIPTTLLASVDAAIGGKTGIDYRAFKNQLGVFAYPQAIFINPEFFNTIDIRLLKAGYAEMLKHALIADLEYWKDLIKTTDFIGIDWRKFIEKSIQIKGNIVIQDPLEKGIRKLLNFGHTFGHAFESFSMENHKIPLLHGEAIAMGIMVEAKLSSKKLGLKKNDIGEINKFFKKTYPIYKFKEENVDELVEIMLQDKKNINEGINFSLIQKIGEGVIDQICSVSEVKQCLIDFIHRDK